MSRLIAGLRVALLAGGLDAAHANDPAYAVEAATKPGDARRWSWDAGYKADLLHSAATGAVGVGNLSLRANADANALFGWAGTTLHTEALLNHGGKPNQRIGSAQGLSNLEVVDSAALDEAGIPIDGEDVFGTYGRSVFLRTSDGQLLVTSVSNGLPCTT